MKIIVNLASFKAYLDNPQNDKGNIAAIDNDLNEVKEGIKALKKMRENLKYNKMCITKGI